ncbi:hypothetical protein COM00_30865 [Bacillus toyonensis]|nr:hypothetical protein COM00_30865 [Bacillus toyonensis]
MNQNLYGFIPYYRHNNSINSQYQLGQRPIGDAHGTGSGIPSLHPEHLEQMFACSPPSGTHIYRDSSDK